LNSASNRQAGELRGFAQRLAGEFQASVAAIVRIRDRGREPNRLRAATQLIDLMLKFFDQAFVKPQLDAFNLKADFLLAGKQ
jgi:hypothetical protein